MALFGLLVGLMIGRILAPEPAELAQVQIRDGGLALWFNEQPELHSEAVEGTLALLFESRGKPANGQLLLNGKQVNWTLRRSEGILALRFVAARPLRGDWVWDEEEDGRWRLSVSLREE